jgi:YidC/Oxa1 family membrane protein insertase
MEKRVLLAVVLSFAVLYGYQAMFPPPKKPVAPPATQSSPSTAPAAGPSAAAQPAKPQTTETPVESTASAQAAPVVGDAQEREVVVDTDVVRAVFTTRGAALKHWQLKKYNNAAGQPLDLVPERVPEGTPRPFTLAVDDAKTTETLQRALFKPSATQLTVQGQPATLTFDYQDASGLTAHTSFTFSASQRYVVDFSGTVTRGATPLVPTVQGGAAIGSGTEIRNKRTYDPHSRPVFYRDGKVTRVDTDKIPQHASVDANFGFAGVDDHYFLAATLPGGKPLNVKYQPLSIPLGDPAGTVGHLVTWSVRSPDAPAGARYFLGPKDFDVLAAVDKDFVRAIDFGMFSWLVVPLLRSLKWINGYVGNYGWSIILLTAIINIAMFPLRHKSVVSMRKMQELQPEVKAIQDRYKNLKMSDPARQKQNVELMNLYRERGVNPASGCVPMLLTLPVLFAFYSMLSVAIELRGAPFMLWIKDLSQHDPLYITPVLMGLTQLVQTRMTPQTSTDPVQQKMFMFMPIIFTAMFVFAPAGLVLYWTASNIWAIAQQVVTNRLIGPQSKRQMRPPAERKMKPVGSGKSDQAKERK